ncbi:MAG: hypothetical protein MI717_06720, partial [Spirochaetales bacterium]|nr:hypothetical protein [Spirochaetales bacterium]
EEERATNYREMAEYLYPEDSAPPPAEPKQEPEVKEEDPRKILPDPAGEQASQYYFQKLLRGLFNENSGQILPVIADTLYLPLHDAGVTKDFVQSELDWFFESYDLSQLGAQDIFQLDSVSTTPLDNGYWRLDVSVYPEYSNALDLVSFWSGTMGFYFRKFPQGWRLAAIGPVN